MQPEDIVFASMGKDPDGNDLVADYKCHCDCGCSKQMNEPVNPSSDLNQCDDCDNGIHYDDLNKVYVNYEDED